MNKRNSVPPLGLSLSGTTSRHLVHTNRPGAAKGNRPESAILPSWFDDKLKHAHAEYHATLKKLLHPELIAKGSALAQKCDVGRNLVWRVNPSAYDAAFSESIASVIDALNLNTTRLLDQYPKGLHPELHAFLTACTKLADALQPVRDSYRPLSKLERKDFEVEGASGNTAWQAFERYQGWFVGLKDIPQQKAERPLFEGLKKAFLLGDSDEAKDLLEHVTADAFGAAQKLALKTALDQLPS